MRVLLDTNVLFDFLCKREPFNADAEKVFLAGLQHRIVICICGLSFVNALYTAKKYGIAKESCITSLKRLLTFCSVTDITKDILLQTLESGWNDTEDALQYISGRSAAVDSIVTRDKRGFADAPIPVYSPCDFLKVI